MPKSKISITINEKTLQDIDSLVDNIYIRNRSQAIEHLIKSSLGENKKAVILLGGPEDRLRIDKDHYCATAPLKNSTVIELAIKKLRENNFKSIYIVARDKILTKIFEILKDGSLYGVKIEYIEEKASKGSADSLRALKGQISSNFLVVFGDIVFGNINIEELWNDHIKHNASATIVLTTSPKPSEKGTAKVEGNKVLSFIQKPKKADTYLVFSPIFVTGPEIFEYAGSSLETAVFPTMIERGLLNGHLTSEKETHIHSKEDLKKI